MTENSGDYANRSVQDRALTYGFVASLIGLPVGIVLGLAPVWILSALGLVIGGMKIRQRRTGT